NEIAQNGTLYSQEKRELKRKDLAPELEGNKLYQRAGSAHHRKFENAVFENSFESNFHKVLQGIFNIFRSNLAFSMRAVFEVKGNFRDRKTPADRFMQKAYLKSIARKALTCQLGMYGLVYLSSNGAVAGRPITD